MKYHSQQRGFTLIELLIVIAVGAIMATLALPSLTNFVRDSRWKTTRLTLISDLNLARGEAIKRNVRILVCSGNTTVLCSNNADWATTGWIVCYDVSPQDGQCDTPPVDGSNPNPFLVRAPIRVPSTAQGLVMTGSTTPMYYNAIGTQGAAGNNGVGFNLVGNWSGYPGRPAGVTSAASSVTVAATGSIMSN